MTREEFMEVVYSELSLDGDNCRANRIIDAADEYAEQESCEDCISRQAALDMAYAYGSYEPEGYFVNVEDIQALPPAMPQVKTGHWITRHYINKNGYSFDMWACSECQTEYSYDAETGVKITDVKFCPNCGRKMEDDKQ